MAPTDNFDKAICRAIPWTLLGAVLVLAGCGEPTIKPKEAEAYVDKWAENAAETLVKEAQRQEQIGPEALLETRLQEAAQSRRARRAAGSRPGRSWRATSTKRATGRSIWPAPTARAPAARR